MNDDYMNDEIEEKQIREIQEKMRIEGFKLPKPAEEKSIEKMAEEKPSEDELTRMRREYMDKYKARTNPLPIMKETGNKIYNTSYVRLLWWVMVLLILIVGIFAYRTFFPEKFRDVITLITNYTISQNQSLSAVCILNSTCNPKVECNQNCTPIINCGINSS